MDSSKEIPETESSDEVMAHLELDEEKPVSSSGSKEIANFSTPNHISPDEMVTMEKFNAVITELKQQMESQNRAILETLNTLIAARGESTNLCIENGSRKNTNSFTPSYQEDVRSYTPGFIKWIGN